MVSSGELLTLAQVTPFQRQLVSGDGVRQGSGGPALSTQRGSLTDKTPELPAWGCQGFVGFTWRFDFSLCSIVLLVLFCF